jgi:hypothetical protein
VTTHFSPDAKGWVVRWTTGTGHVGWWYGPDHGWGTTSGGLDYSVALWDTKREAVAAIRQLGPRRGLTPMKVADAVAFSIAECERRKADVLAGDHPDRLSIAAANDRTKAYLEGGEK